MQLYVYSRDALARVRPHEVAHMIISVTSALDDVARFPIPSTCVGVLRLAFADLIPSGVDASTRSLLFTPAQAEQIWSFVDRHRANVERIVVHCDAGHSRSPAIAAALARAFGLEHENYFRQYEPNQHVYDTMVAARAERSLVPRDAT